MNCLFGTKFSHSTHTTNIGSFLPIYYNNKNKCFQFKEILRKYHKIYIILILYLIV